MKHLVKLQQPQYNLGNWNSFIQTWVQLESFE